MHGLLRQGLDAVGLPPRWFTPDATVWPVRAVATTPALTLSLVDVPVGVSGQSVVCTLADLHEGIDFPSSIALIAENGTVDLGAFSPVEAVSAAVTPATATLSLVDGPTAISAVALAGTLQPNLTALFSTSLWTTVEGTAPVVVWDAPNASLATVQTGTAEAVLAVWLDAVDVTLTAGTSTPALDDAPAAIVLVAASGEVVWSFESVAVGAWYWVQPTAAFMPGVIYPTLVSVLNADSLGISEYSRPWLSVVEHEGQVYGLTATGLERLQGHWRRPQHHGCRRGSWPWRRGRCAMCRRGI